MVDRIAHWRACGVDRFVYFIQAGDDGPVKIGVAIDPASRATSLQSGNPYLLHIREIIPAGFEVETQLHIHFCEQRLIGEWFDWPDVVLAFAAGLSDRAFAFHAERGVVPVAWSSTWEPVSDLDLVLMDTNPRIPQSRSVMRIIETRASVD